VLSSYCSMADIETVMKTAIAAYPPVVRESEITLKVDHDFLREKLQELLPRLRGFLCEHLHNDHVVLNVTVHTGESKVAEQKVLFTAKDKFDHFVALNPVVGDLKSIFGLEIE